MLSKQSPTHCGLMSLQFNTIQSSLQLEWLKIAPILFVIRANLSTSTTIADAPGTSYTLSVTTGLATTLFVHWRHMRTRGNQLSCFKTPGPSIAFTWHGRHLTPFSFCFRYSTADQQTMMQDLAISVPFQNRRLFSTWCLGLIFWVRAVPKFW